MSSSSVDVWIVRLDQSVGGRAVGEAVGRSVVGSVPLSFRSWDRSLFRSVGRRLVGWPVDRLI